jgi:hypothetical protein
LWNLIALPQPGRVRSERIARRKKLRCRRIFAIDQKFRRPIRNPIQLLLGLLLLPLEFPQIHLLLLTLLLCFTILILASLIVYLLSNHKPVCNSAYQEPPVQINRLQRSQQAEGDDLGEPAFVLLRLPVDFERPNGSKLGGDGVEDLEAKVMARVTPGGHEDDKVWAYYGMVDVVKDFGSLQSPELASTDSEGLS